jgi:hypothetical protein
MRSQDERALVPDSLDDIIILQTVTLTAGTPMVECTACRRSASLFSGA